jgi:hypothetical protein
MYTVYTHIFQAIPGKAIPMLAASEVLHLPGSFSQFQDGLATGLDGNAQSDWQQITTIANFFKK